MQVKKVALEWLDYKKDFIKISTYAYYKTIVTRHIIPCFGNIDIRHFSERIVQETVLRWQHGDENNTKLKISTVKNMIMILKQCVKYAQKILHIRMPEWKIQYAISNDIPSKKVFDIQAQKQIIEAVLTDFSSRSLGIVICISCGIRIGELCALQWKDIDFNNNTIKISKTLQRVYLPEEKVRTQIVISTPKTMSSIREIPLPHIVVDLIKKIEIKEENFYLLTNDRCYTEPTTYRQFYKKFLQQHGIEILNFHSLRHTFATQCIENGANIKSVSDLLGHSKINTTLDMYVHPGMEEKRKCIELLNWEI